jgi:alkylhydroperoxidase/carboxymuconolactone decarboxylase family protein YurZ
VEEVLLQGASDGEIAETLDVGLYMGGSLATKSVRYAFQIWDELRRSGGQPATSPSARQ